MTKIKVFVTRRIPKPGLDILQQDCDVQFWDSDEAIPQDELLKKVQGVGALLCMLTDKIDDEVLAKAGENLRIVSTMSVGYEHIDLEACKRRGIAVTNTPNVSTDSVSELTVSLLLLVARRLYEGIRAVHVGEWGKWKPMWLCGVELTNKTVGILGLGRIGYGVAKRLKPFGIERIIYHDVCRVSYADDIGATYVDFPTLLSDSDMICICCNLTPQTKHKFNTKAFEKMKNSAVLVNSGRGGVIQHDDLYEALRTNTIAAAGLDVTEPEPLPKDHLLLTLNNCIVLPHMGSNTWESRNSMSEIAAANIISVLNGTNAVGEVIPPRNNGL
ncbi:glyoxylate reductase/hydroxypyruvate reductase-like [Mytilus galloprovincialis]|uniref:glyoxylate reductase/hydroxypyruvate reductase-like n=1 Tax=Mytilus galloprovincialis TaxID=29158 RepID=UPI003F7B78F5